MNVETAPGQIQVDLSETVVDCRVDATSVQIAGEVKTRIET